MHTGEDEIRSSKQGKYRQLNVVIMIEGYCGRGRFEDLMTIDEAVIRVKEA
jgi:hypothetical protein